MSTAPSSTSPSSSPAPSPSPSPSPSSLPPSSSPSSDEKKDKRVCDYYLSLRGCLKGEQCDHVHPLAPNGAKTNRICDFWGTPRGCSKGDQCGFLHPVRYNALGEVCHRVCEFYLTRQGCVKGAQCNFLHPKAIPSNVSSKEFATKTRPSGSGPKGYPTRRFGSALAEGHKVTIDGKRVCEFYLTQEGCAEGPNCRFLHPRGQEAQDALRAKDFIKDMAERDKQRRTQGGAVATASPSSNGPSPSVRKDPKSTPCKFFKSPNGCKKGDECEFSHSF